MAVKTEAQLKADIDANYTTNGNGDITGSKINTISSDSNESLFSRVDATDANVALNTAKVSADGLVTTHSDVTDAGSGAIITDAERTKLGTLLNAFLGYFADDTALATAHPTATTINYALVGSTNTFWSWNGSAWANTGNTSTGDMLASLYDPQGVAGDAFLFSNMTGTVLEAQLEVAVQNAITANTAKVGITAQQASDITTNNAKTGITAQQASDIATNNAKTGITAQQASDITANNAKVTQATQVSAGEKTAGTETALRSYSPKDIADMAGDHGGGGGGSSPEDTITNVSTSSSVSTANQTVVCDTSGGAITLTLDATPTQFQTVIVLGDATSETNHITIAGNGKNVNGSSNYVITEEKGSKVFWYSGTEWRIIQGFDNIWYIEDGRAKTINGISINAETLVGVSGETFAKTGDDITGDVDRAVPNDAISTDVIYSVDSWGNSGTERAFYNTGTWQTGNSALKTSGAKTFCVDFELTGTNTTVEFFYARSGNSCLWVGVNGGVFRFLYGDGTTIDQTITMGSLTNGVQYRLICVVPLVGIPSAWLDGVEYTGTLSLTAGIGAITNDVFFGGAQVGLNLMNGYLSRVIYADGEATNPASYDGTFASLTGTLTAQLDCLNGNPEDSTSGPTMTWVKNGTVTQVNDYATTNNFIPYKFINGSAIQLSSASIVVKDENDIPISSYNVMWSSDGGTTYSSVFTRSNFILEGLLTSSTNYRIAIQVVGGQKVKSIEMSENQTTMQVTADGIVMKVNGQVVQSMNNDRSYYHSDVVVTPTAPVEGVKIYSEAGVTKSIDSNGDIVILGTAGTGEVNAPLASQAEAEAGVEGTKTMTPLRTKQAIDALGGDLVSTNNLSDVDNAVTALANIGGVNNVRMNALENVVAVNTLHDILGSGEVAYELGDGKVDGYNDELSVDAGSSASLTYDPIKKAYTGGGLLPNSVALLHSNTTNGSTTLVDSAFGKTCTMYGGADHQTSVVLANFGTTSIELTASGSEYIDIADSDDFHFGTGDFRIEMFVRFKSLGGGSEVGFARQFIDNNNFWAFDFTSGSGPRFISVNGGSVEVNFQQGSGTGWAINTWYHVCVQRVNNDFDIFRDFVSVAGITDSDAILNYATPLEFGKSASPAPNYLDAYLDEILVVKGVGALTGVPSSPYTSSAGNFTLVSEPVTASVQPESLRAMVIVEEDGTALTVNTDFKLYASRDNGTTWTEGTLYLHSAFNSLANNFATDDIDVSSQPSGTSIRYKIETFNSKAGIYRGVNFTFRD